MARPEQGDLQGPGADVDLRWSCRLPILAPGSRHDPPSHAPRFLLYPAWPCPSPGAWHCQPTAALPLAQTAPQPT